MRAWQKINQLKNCLIQLFNTGAGGAVEPSLYKPKFDEEQTWLGIG